MPKPVGNDDRTPFSDPIIRTAPSYYTNPFRIGETNDYASIILPIRLLISDYRLEQALLRCSCLADYIVIRCHRLAIANCGRRVLSCALRDYLSLFFASLFRFMSDCFACLCVYDQIIVVVSLCALRVGVFPRGLGFFTPMLKAKQRYI